MWAVHGVLFAVGPVVEGHPGLVQAKRRADRQCGAPAGPAAHRRSARQRVPGHGEQGGDAEQFRPGPQALPGRAPAGGLVGPLAGGPVGTAAGSPVRGTAGALLGVPARGLVGALLGVRSGGRPRSARVRVLRALFSVPARGGRSGPVRCGRSPTRTGQAVIGHGSGRAAVCKTVPPPGREQRQGRHQRGRNGSASPPHAWARSRSAKESKVVYCSASAAEVPPSGSLK